MGLAGVSPLTVVVADDDSLVRMSLHFALESRGFSVVEVESSARLAVVVTETQPAVCIIDINMPGDDLVKRIATVQRTSPSTAILVLSGEPTGPPELADIGIPYLRKPIELAALLEAVNSATGYEPATLGG